MKTQPGLATSKRLGAGWRVVGILFLLVLSATGLTASDSPPCRSYEEGLPLVVLALDGVPFSVIEEARNRGAFAGWPATRPLIATFPSMTNVSFAALLAPLGIDAIAGYEVPHFDHDRKKMVGRSPFGAKKRSYAWRDVLEKDLIGLWKHTVGYAVPRHKALVELSQIEGTILESNQEVLVVYIAATDSLTHFRGYDGILRFLLEFDHRLSQLQLEYRRQHGHCLRLVMLSDHGNTERKVRRIRGLRQRLRTVGFDTGSRLLAARDAVAPTFGLCNYGAIYVQEGRAQYAAEAVASHPNVDLAAFVSGEDRITVISDTGSAVLGWRPDAAGKSFSYSATRGDPLRLSGVVSRLESQNGIDEDGFAAAEDWLVHSVDSPYPNAPKRIVDALTGAWVRHSASVLFSIAPGYAWGRSAGYIAASAKGGYLEGTHGGLDSISSIGFFLVNDPSLDPGRVVSATDALSFLASRKQATASPTGMESQP